MQVVLGRSGAKEFRTSANVNGTPSDLWLRSQQLHRFRIDLAATRPPMCPDVSVLTLKRQSDCLAVSRYLVYHHR